MKYDESFLRDRGLLESPTRGTLEGREYKIEYEFDRTSRLVYVRTPENVSSDEVIELLLRNLIFDYAWIASEDLHVVRTYGYLRSFRLAGVERADSLSKKVRLLANLNHSSIHTLFVPDQASTQLNAAVTELRNRMACLVGVDSTPYERALFVQRLIERLTVLLFLESRERNAGELLEELRVSPSLWYDVKELVSSDRIGRAVRDSFEPLDPLNEEEWESALADMIDTFLRYEWTLNPWKSSSESVTPAILEDSQEQFVVPLVNLNGAIARSSSDPRQTDRPSRRTGSYYTPEHIAHYIASRAVAGWIEELTGVDVYEPGELRSLTPERRSELKSVLENVRILDPACGAGVFLRCAADWLSGLWKLIDQEEGHTRICASVISRNLTGADIMESAARTCSLILRLWAVSQGMDEGDAQNIEPVMKICNTLTEGTHARNDRQADVVAEKPLYDIIIGNPPYGNIMSDADKKVIEKNQDHCVGGGRTGTWSVSAHFLVRARTLLNDGGWLGLLLPNSLLRVKQFEKTRRFLLENADLVEVVDEASPFRDVTLEMVSVFAKTGEKKQPRDVRVISRRPDLPRLSTIPVRTLQRTPMILLYRDEILDAIQERGLVSQIFASRGRDLSRNHTSRTRSERFNVPYTTKGRSIVHYGISLRHLDYADDSFMSDKMLRHSYENEYLVATKNLPYPRCALKPKGIIHGGGVVRLQLRQQNADRATMGLILNSKLVRYLCIRHFTNYSELTTCLNTGIMENIPIVYPEDPRPFSTLFHLLTSIRVEAGSDAPVHLASLQNLADSLVYELCLSEDTDLQSLVSDICRCGLDTSDMTTELTTSLEIREAIDRLSRRPDVTAIGRSPRTEVPVSQMPMLK